MSSFASGSKPSSSLTPTTLTLLDDQAPSQTQRPDEHESRPSSLSSAASGLKAMFRQPRSTANSSRTKHKTEGDRENKRVYGQNPILQLMNESPFTEKSSNQRITVTLRYESVENAKDKARESEQKIRLTIDCGIKCNRKYVKFNHAHVGPLATLKASIPTATWAKLRDQLKDDDAAYEAAKEFFNELFRRMF